MMLMMMADDDDDDADADADADEDEDEDDDDDDMSQFVDGFGQDIASGDIVKTTENHSYLSCSRVLLAKRIGTHNGSLRPWLLTYPPYT